jgi:hypothetical protein
MAMKEQEGVSDETFTKVLDETEKSLNTLIEFTMAKRMAELTTYPTSRSEDHEMDMENDRVNAQLMSGATSTNATLAANGTVWANKIATSYEVAAVANGTAAAIETVVANGMVVLIETAVLIEMMAAIETAAMPDPARHTTHSEVIGTEIITKDTMPIPMEETCQMPLHPPIAAIADYGSEDMDESE